jgi:hypothetical protein
VGREGPIKMYVYVAYISAIVIKKCLLCTENEIKNCTTTTVPIVESSKNGDNHPVSNITLEFFILGVTCLLKNESYMYSTNISE